MGAYDLLIDSNLIHSEPSRGFFVATPTRNGRSRLAPDFVLETAHCARNPRTNTALASGVHVPAASVPVRFDFKIGRTLYQQAAMIDNDMATIAERILCLLPDPDEMERYVLAKVA